MGNKLAEQNC